MRVSFSSKISHKQTNMKFEIKFSKYIEQQEHINRLEDIITANSIVEAIEKLKKAHNKNDSKISSIISIKTL